MSEYKVQLQMSPIKIKIVSVSNVFYLPDQESHFLLMGKK